MADQSLDYYRDLRRQLWNEGLVRRSGEMRPGKDGTDQDVWVIGRDEEHVRRVAAARALFARFPLTEEQRESLLMSLVAAVERNEHAERLAARGAVPGVRPVDDARPTRDPAGR